MPAISRGTSGPLLLCNAQSRFGILAMQLEDEVVGIRRRRAELERALLRLDDALAVTLIRAVIEDMDARIAVLEAAMQLRDDVVKPA
jgi:hypothetical protein